MGSLVEVREIGAARLTLREQVLGTTQARSSTLITQHGEVSHDWSSMSFEGQGVPTVTLNCPEPISIPAAKGPGRPA